MSGIVLSSSVRQNLLSLQSTADLLATTQSRLSTGKKVNTALDNPTNYFTAQSLDGRASDISNLLDGIGNGVQVLQAANAGITSLSKLVDTAKSIANQALQTTVGYSTKSNVSATIAGATALDLRGTTTFTSATATSNVITSGNAGGTTAITSAITLGGVSASLVGVAATAGDGRPLHRRCTRSNADFSVEPNRGIPAGEDPGSESHSAQGQTRVRAKLATSGEAFRSPKPAVNRPPDRGLALVRDDAESRKTVREGDAGPYRRRLRTCL